jgi:hypothetical protein
MPNFGLSSTRAEASRRNGAKSRGPKTAKGKARAAQNALKHGLRAQKCVVLPGERASAFAAFEAALLEELAPQGALQSVLAQRIVAASWRLARSERLEAELFARMMDGGSMGLALIRDSNGARSFDTLLRYRGTALAELWRALRTLKALQAERAAQQAEQAAQEGREAARMQRPDEPERRSNPDDSGRPGSQVDEFAANPALAWLPPWPFPAPAAPAPGGPVPCVQPFEPETRGKPPAPRSPRAEIEQKSQNASLLAGTRPAQRGLAHGVSPAGAGRSGSAPSSARSRPRPRRSPRPPARTRAGPRDRAAAPR